MRALCCAVCFAVLYKLCFYKGRKMLCIWKPLRAVAQGERASFGTRRPWVQIPPARLLQIVNSLWYKKLHWFKNRKKPVYTECIRNVRKKTMGRYREYFTLYYRLRKTAQKSDTRTYSPDGGAHVRKIHRRCSLSNWEILLNYFNPAIW